jgi:AraC-like DNA-binding protein
MDEIRAWQNAQALKLAEEALALLTADIQQANTRDRRIEQAIDWVEQHLHEKITLQDVAAQIHLSPERTRHLFVQEAGVSFSQFLMWKRIKSAIVFAVRDGMSLTEVALRAGFADQAHFCRLFKRTFGIPAGGLLQNSRSIQFIHPSAS